MSKILTKVNSRYNNMITDNTNDLSIEATTKTLHKLSSKPTLDLDRVNLKPKQQEKKKKSFKKKNDIISVNYKVNPIVRRNISYDSSNLYSFDNSPTISQKSEKDKYISN